MDTVTQLLVLDLCDHLSSHFHTDLCGQTLDALFLALCCSSGQTVDHALGYVDAGNVGILRMLSEMEETGRDCGGNPLSGNKVDKETGEIIDKSATPKFYKGASVTPLYDPIFLQINKLRQKVESGAEYIQTQGIFDLDSFKRFMEEVDKAGIKTHIMAGIIPLKAAGMAKFMNANVPGIDVPQSMIDRLAAAAAEGKEKGVKGLPAKVGMEMAAEMIAKIKDEKLCDGVHVMAIGAEKNVPTILDLAGVTV